MRLLLDNGEKPPAYIMLEDNTVRLMSCNGGGCAEAVLSLGSGKASGEDGLVRIIEGRVEGLRRAAAAAHSLRRVLPGIGEAARRYGVVSISFEAPGAYLVIYTLPGSWDAAVRFSSGEATVVVHNGGVEAAGSDAGRLLDLLSALMDGLDGDAGRLLGTANMLFFRLASLKSLAERLVGRETQVETASGARLAAVRVEGGVELRIDAPGLVSARILYSQRGFTMAALGCARLTPGTLVEDIESCSATAAHILEDARFNARMLL